MNSITDIELFVRIVDSGTLAAAAASLGVTRSTVARRLAQLERQLEVKLLIRTPRRMALTPAGKEYLGYARRIAADIRRAAEAVSRVDQVPRGVLKVTSPPGFTVDVIASVLAEYAHRYPQTHVEFLVTSRLVDLIAEGYDVALRITPPEDSALIAHRAYKSRLQAVASAAYLDARGTPQSAADLSEHDCIRAFNSSGNPRSRWPLIAGGSVAVRGRVVSNSMAALRRAVVAGLGVGLLPVELVAHETSRGLLRPVLTELVGVEVTVNLVFPERLHLAPRVRAFIDMAIPVLRRTDWAEVVGPCPSVDRLAE